VVLRHSPHGAVYLWPGAISRLARKMNGNGIGVELLAQFQE
jgi:hypothetical protein